jgi:hypothetical protein
MDFLAGVNRIFRSEGIVRDDDDELTSFTVTAFAASLETAKIAIQDELAHLVAMDLIPYEEKDAEVTLVDGTRLYALATDFVRLRDPSPFLLRVNASGESENIILHEWPGGEKNLRRVALDYREKSGEPSWFYLPGGTTKQIGFYLVPDSNADGDIYRYYYEGSVTVSDSADTLPFASDTEAEAFVRLAAGRFRYLRTDPFTRRQLYPGGVRTVGGREDDLATLQGLLRTKPPTGKYGSRAV